MSSKKLYESHHENETHLKKHVNLFVYNVM